ncbi:acrosomal protein KIAA1210-like [Ctenodactylus gundi]
MADQPVTINCSPSLTPVHIHIPSFSGTPIQPETISEGPAGASAGDESPESLGNRAHTLSIRKERTSLFEPPSGPEHSQSSNACALPSITPQPADLSTTKTPYSCLDSSAARQKVSLKPRKRRKNRVKPRLPLDTEEGKDKTQPKEADHMMLENDKTDASGQEQSGETKSHDQETTDQSRNTGAPGNLSHRVSAGRNRRRRGRGTCVPGTDKNGAKETTLIQSTKGNGKGNRAKALPAAKTARGCHSWHLPTEKQNTKQLSTTQAETTTSQELLSASDDVGRQNADTDVEAGKASARQIVPKDSEMSMVSGPPPHHEHGASGHQKTESRTFLLPVAERPSTSQEEAVLSVAAEAQMLSNPPDRQSKEEETANLWLQDSHVEIEDVPPVRSENPPGSVLRAFTESLSDMTSTMAERGVSTERLPPRSCSQSLEKPEAEAVSPDSQSVSEKGRGSEQQLAPAHPLQFLKKPGSDGVSPLELKSSECAAEGRSDSAEVGPDQSSLSLGKRKQIFSESKNFSVISLSEGYQGPSQAIRKPEDEGVTTVLHSHVEKYRSPEDWSETKEDPPLGHPAQALEKPRDQQEVFPVPKEAGEEQGFPIDPSLPASWSVVQQGISSSSVSECTEQHGSVKTVRPRSLFQPWVNSEFEQQVSADPSSIAFEWNVSAEPLPPRMTSNHRAKPKVEQTVYSCPEITTPEEVSVEALPPISQHLAGPRVEKEVFAGAGIPACEGSNSVGVRLPVYSFQPWVSPQTEQQVSLFPESTTIQRDVFAGPLPPQGPTQPLMRPEFHPQMTLDSLSTTAQWSHAMGPVPPMHSFRPWASPPCEKQGCAGANSADVEGGISEPLPPRPPFHPWLIPAFEQVCVHPPHPGMSSQPQMSVVQQPVFTELVSGSAQWSVSAEAVPPTHPFQPWVCLPLGQPVCTGLESPAAEGSISMGFNLPSHSQPLTSPVFQEEVASSSVSTSAEWRYPVGPIPPSQPIQSWVIPTFEQQVSPGPGSVAIEEGITRQQLFPVHFSQAAVEQTVQNMPPSFESFTVEEGGISEELPGPNHQFLAKSTLQEISPYLENTAAEENISEESLLSGDSSQSFVRFAGQEFSGNSATQTGMYAPPLPPSHTSISLWPQVQCQGFSDWETGDPERAVSSSHPLKSLESPADLLSSERAAMRWHRSQGRALGKLEHGQETYSAFDSCPEDWTSPGEKMPFGHPSHVPCGSECQLPTGSVNVSREWSSPEEHLAPRHAFPGVGYAQDQQPYYSGPTRVAAGETVFENNPGSWSPPRGSDSAKITSRFSYGPEGFMKSIPTSAPKPEMVNTAPSWTMSMHCNDAVLRRDDGNDGGHSNLPTHKAHVENLSEVRGGRIPSPHKHENPSNFTLLPLATSDAAVSQVGRELPMRSASHGCLSIPESYTTVPIFAEKHQIRPKYDSVSQKQPYYKTPGKSPGWQSDHGIPEPTWINTAKQRQRIFQSHAPAKEYNIKSSAGAKAETRDPRHGMRPEAAQETFQKGTGPTEENQPRKAFASNIHRQTSQIRLLVKPPRSDGSENQEMLSTFDMENDTMHL